jgi:hypothetical protein
VSQRKGIASSHRNSYSGGASQVFFFFIAMSQSKCSIAKQTKQNFEGNPFNEYHQRDE